MPKPKILIVDDEPFNVDYLQQELDELGYDTISAVDGSEALRMVEAQAPDLVLLDIMMPVMDGFEVLSRLKANPSWRGIPVIVISATSDLQSVVRGIHLGAEDYLPKPFEPTLLHARISSSMEKKRLHDLEHLYLQSLEREMEIGRDIQHGFLPAQLPGIEGWEIASYFKSAREVAGDFYDAFPIGTDNHLCLIVADVCDKGVGAALFMTLFRSLLRFTMGMADTFGECTPVQRLRYAARLTNDYIADTHGDTGMFATVFAGLLDPVRGALSYINAGHESPLLIQESGAFRELKSTGPAIGVVPGVEFAVQHVELGPGDLLFAFTDGAPDALSPRGDPFGKERLLSLLHSDAPADALLAGIQAELAGHIGQADPFDDITLLAIRRLPAAG